MFFITLYKQSINVKIGGAVSILNYYIRKIIFLILNGIVVNNVPTNDKTTLTSFWDLVE